MKFSIGDKVYTTDDPKYIGIIQQVDQNSNQIWVRWSKGFATWETEADLRLATGVTK